MPKQPPDHNEPLVAFLYARMVDEPNSPHSGLGTNHEQNGQEQYPWTEQVPGSREPDPPNAFSGSSQSVSSFWS